jgi:signal transduction histidine kinase
LFSRAYKDADGTIEGVIVITTVVTEQVISRKKIESCEKELRIISCRLDKELSTTLQLQRHKDDFLSIASHELKTP